MRCCHGFMTKMNVGITSVWMKGRCGLNANKMSRQFYGKRRVLVQLHYKGKWWCDFIVDASANIASWQKWMLAWLQYKDKCWHSFMVKTLDVATLQKLLNWLRWKDKCWCSLIAKRSMLHNKNKQQQRACQKKISWHIWTKKKKKFNKERELQFYSLACQTKKKKKKLVQTKH